MANPKKAKGVRPSEGLTLSEGFGRVQGVMRVVMKRR